MIKVRPSEIKTFKKCRRQWEIKYVHGIGLNEEDTALDYEPGAAKVGTMVHQAMESYYKGNDALFTPSDWADPKDVVLAQRIVEGYLEWLEETGADDGYTVGAAELELEVPWPAQIRGEDVAVIGHVDLLATDPWGVVKLIDHKTVQSLSQYARQLQVDSQTLTYAMMLEMLGIHVGGAIHNAMRRVMRTATATPPFYERIEVSYSPNQLNSHFNQTAGVLEDMVKARHALERLNDRTKLYPNPSRDCTWSCPHLGICPSFDDGSDIDGILVMMKKKGQA